MFNNIFVFAFVVTFFLCSCNEQRDIEFHAQGRSFCISESYVYHGEPFWIAPWIRAEGGGDIVLRIPLMDLVEAKTNSDTNYFEFTIPYEYEDEVFVAPRNAWNRNDPYTGDLEQIHEGIYVIRHDTYNIGWAVLSKYPDINAEVALDEYWLGVCSSETEDLIDPSVMCFGGSLSADGIWHYYSFSGDILVHLEDIKSSIEGMMFDFQEQC